MEVPMKRNTTFVLMLASCLVGCSGNSEERAPGAGQPGEVTSAIEGQPVVSQRDPSGAVHAQLFDRATLAATLTLDPSGKGTLALTRGGTPGTVGMRAGTPLEDVNRGFHNLWAIAVRENGATPLREESWSS